MKANVEISVWCLMIVQRDDITNCTTWAFNTEDEAIKKRKRINKDTFYCQITRNEVKIKLTLK